MQSSTVKQRFTDTRLLRRVCFVSGGKEARKPLHFLSRFNPLITDTRLIRTISVVPLVCALKGGLNLSSSDGKLEGKRLI